MSQQGSPAADQPVIIPPWQISAGGSGGPVPTPVTTPTNVTSHAQPLRGIDSVSSSHVFGGRFGRMFRNLPVFTTDPAMLRSLAVSMIQQADDDKRDGADDDDENVKIPAGYTYLGQFIDHDITFDPVSSLQRQNDPDALTDFRTPKFDLDSLYGRGPADQPYLYDSNGIKLLLGGAVSDQRVIAGPDLQRNGAGRALIGDPRNDENLIVSQLQTVFIRFHNRVIDFVANQGFTDDDLLKEAQRLVRWHYQWVVVHDFLPRITGPDGSGKAMVDEMLGSARYATGGAAPGQGTTIAPDLHFYHFEKNPFMPVEFSVAAYRFGHSMIRPSYLINDFVKRERQNGPPFRVPIFSASQGQFDNLNGFRPLPPQWGFQWKFFFPLSQGQKPQNSYKIDTVLSNPLANLPGPAIPGVPASLAERNLLRGLALELPAGQDIASAMGVEPLRTDDFSSLPKELAPLGQRTPLWYYILKEAEVKGQFQSLGPVGGRIVAEVLIGLLSGDPLSFLSVQPTWQPDQPFTTTAGSFAMADLITFALGDLAAQ